MNARDTSAKPFARAALYQEVAELLRNRIFAHELAPGEWIDEQAVAISLGISRTPLREALKVLASEGLVVLKPRRGCYVAELSERDLDEVFPVMALLEGRCAYEASLRASAADIERLLAIHADLEACAKKDDVNGFFGANDAFHGALQDIAGNGWLKHLIDETRKVIKLTRRFSLLSDGRIDQSLLEHRDIMAALRAKDAAGAAQRMHDHLLSGLDALKKLGG
ncbi:MAG: GntR family transcriptional regulator [Rhodocyclaceae bacterium]|jgi:DNA-binding GntR family transcriptional regulator|nr:GntR family transcriptional regulator [Rhodocyclaceae bacterium]